MVRRFPSFWSETQLYKDIRSPMGEWSVIGKQRQEPGTSLNTVRRSCEGCLSGPTDIWELVAKDRHGAPKWIPAQLTELFQSWLRAGRVWGWQELTEKGKGSLAESWDLKNILNDLYSLNSCYKLPNTWPPLDWALCLILCLRLREVNWVVQGHTGAELVLVAGSAQTQRSFHSTRWVYIEN